MARKKKNKEEAGTDIGVVMTCSLFLIILTFFILLNSIAVIDDKRSRQAIGSLVHAFGSFDGDFSNFEARDSLMSLSPPPVEQNININELFWVQCPG